MSGSCFEPGFHGGYTKVYIYVVYVYTNIYIYIQHICGVYTCQLDGFGTAEVSFGQIFGVSNQSEALRLLSEIIQFWIDWIF